MNNSISVTLEKFYTETKVTFNDQLTQDQFWLNGEKVSGKELERKLKIYGYCQMSWHRLVCRN